MSRVEQVERHAGASEAIEHFGDASISVGPVRLEPYVAQTRKLGFGGFGAGGGLGKSGARIVASKDVGVTFKDVAGQEEAKVYTGEKVFTNFDYLKK